MALRQVAERAQAKLALASVEKDITATKRTIAATQPGSDLEAIGLKVLEGHESARAQLLKALEPAPVPPKE